MTMISGIKTTAKTELNWTDIYDTMGRRWFSEACELAHLICIHICANSIVENVHFAVMGHVLGDCCVKNGRGSVPTAKTEAESTAYMDI